MGQGSGIKWDLRLLETTVWEWDFFIGSWDCDKSEN